MDVVGERLHVRKLSVGGDVPLGVACALPRVVDIQVDIASIFHSARDHCIRDAPNRSIINFAGELVPAIPPHWRRSRQAITGNVAQLREGKPWRRQSSFRLGALRSARQRVAAGIEHRHRNLVSFHRTVIRHPALLLALGAEGDNQVQIATLECPFADGQIAKALQNLAGDRLAGLFQIQKYLAVVSISGGHTQKPKPAQVSLCRQ